MGISPTHAATSSMNPRPTMELAFESSVPIVTSSIVSGDVDLIRGFTDAEIMGFVEELEMLAASHSTVSHIPSLRPQAVSAPSECKLERQDSAVSAASGRWADLLPPSRSDATPLIESIFAMPTMPTTKSLPAGSSLPPSRSQSIGSNGQHSFSFASSHTAGSQPSSPSSQKRKRAHPEIVSECRSEDKFQSKMLKKTSSETTEEILVQRLARTADVAGSLSPTQHPAPSSHSLVNKSGLQKCPLIPIHRGVVAEQPSEMRAVPSAIIVKTESYEKAPSVKKESKKALASRFELIGETDKCRMYKFQCPDSECQNSHMYVDTPWLTSSSNKFRCTSKYCKAKKQKNNHTIPASVMRQHLTSAAEQEGFPK